MDSFWKTIIWQQFGAAIDMLDNALRACPEHYGATVYGTIQQMRQNTPSSGLLSIMRFSGPIYIYLVRGGKILRRLPRLFAARFPKSHIQKMSFRLISSIAARNAKRRLRL
jgi:hypothetical protein